MMKKYISAVLVLLLFLIPNAVFVCKNNAYADSSRKYYIVYDKDSKNELFLKGDGIEVGDQYISSDNKLYNIVSVNDNDKTAYAEFVENVELPKINVRRKDKILNNNNFNSKDYNKNNIALASTKKVVGLYHTHNDESYPTGDGYDSIYGKGGIHDIGALLKSNLEKCNMIVYYDETLHLPHNSGAYTRSQATAARLLEKGSHAIFDIHRDAVPRKEYFTNVNGKDMSKVRMVIGAANLNSSANKDLALRLKAYADEVYPNLIKDIYIGKGNYNQQLTNAAILFEMGADTIEKYLVERSVEPLAKTIDVVLYGTDQASENSLNDVEFLNGESDSNFKEGVLKKGNKGSLDALWIVLAVLLYVTALFLVAFFTNKQFNYHIKRFFSEITAGIFGKKKPDRDI